jgi:hypothetical protein
MRRRNIISEPHARTPNRGGLKLREVESTFRAFSDGTIVEAVRSSPTSTELQLLVRRDGRETVQPRFEKDGELLLPPRISDRLAAAIRFPPAAMHKDYVEPLAAAGFDKAFQTVADQFWMLKEMAAKCLSIDPPQLTLVVAYAFYTWLADRFAQAPYLSIIGPLASGKTQLLRFLNCCCRRPLLLSDISLAGLYSLTDRFAATLLTDEADFGADIRSRDLQRLLRGGHTLDGVAYRSGRTYNLFGPKVISSRAPIPDAALASRAIEISMSRCTEGPEFTPDSLGVTGLYTIVQPLLLRFRLQHYHRDLSVQPALSGLSPRSRDKARALAGPFVDFPDLQDSIVTILRQREPDVQARHSDESELLVLEAFLMQIHKHSEPYVTVGCVARWTNGLLQYRGEQPRFQARAVGPILRQLGLSTAKIGSKGIGICLTNDVRAHLHRQAARYGVIRAADDCPLCAKQRSSEQKNQSAKRP